jgi:hypothetical protein
LTSLRTEAPISSGAKLMLTGGLDSQLVEFVGGAESHRREYTG